MHALFTVLVFVVGWHVEWVKVSGQTIDEMNDRLLYAQYGMLYRHYDYFWPRGNDTIEVVTLDKLIEEINELRKQPEDVQIMTKINWPQSALDPAKDKLFRENPHMMVEKPPPINVTIVGYERKCTMSTPASIIIFCSPQRMAPLYVLPRVHMADYAAILKDTLELNHTIVCCLILGDLEIEEVCIFFVGWGALKRPHNGHEAVMPTPEDLPALLVGRKHTIRLIPVNNDPPPILRDIPAAVDAADLAVDWFLLQPLHE
jgi:hypothetical protein